jgi:RNA polymerase sigma factor (sigma-70 family)
MAAAQLGGFLRHLGALADARAAGDLTDGQLLERFCRRREQTAFAILVHRHGPMVLAVCRRTLPNPADAEDAFQATFLVLARKGPSVRKRESVGSWLYGVAYRIALKARAQAAQRRSRESRAVARAQAGPLAELTRQELWAVLDEELSRLPEKYRAPLVLCCLEGKTHEQAARELGWPKSSLTSRLVRARGLLQRRLVRRGIALPAGLLAAALLEETAQAAVPALLTLAVVRGATPALSGQAVAAGPIPDRVAALAEGMLRATAASRARITAALLLAVSAVCLGVSVLGYEAVAARPPGAGPEDAPAPAAGSRDRAVAPGEGTAHVDRYGDPLPPGALARLGTLRFRHQHTVSRVAFTDGGRAVLSASWDGTVRLWEADTGREIRRFPRHDGLTSPAFSPDGKTVAGVADPPQGRKAIRLWDLASGKEVRRIDCPENVDLFRFSPDGALLATRAARSVPLWDRATGKEVGRIPLPEGGAGPVAFSADGRVLAAVCADGTIRLWEVPAGREVKRFPSPQGSDVGCLAFAPDGRELACGGGQPDRTVRLLDVGTGQELHRFGPYGGWVESVAFSPDGRRLATGDQCGRIRVYDLAAGRELCRCGLHDDNWVMALAFSPDRKTLAAGGTNEKAVRFFDAATGEELHRSAGHQDEVTGVALLPGGDTVVSAGRDGLIAVWAPAGGRVVRQWQHPGGATSLALSPDGKTVATGGQDGTARIWDVATGPSTG